MRRALHDPERGYYARRIRGIGRRGDFATAPGLARCFARAVAAWAARALRETGCRDLIEIGPGDGTLAEQVRRHLPWGLRWRVRRHLVETSAPLARLQQERLGRGVRWHGDPRAALDACGGRAVIYSNELVDAFPVRRFCRVGEEWRELYLEGAPPREALVAGDKLPESTVFAQPHSAGQWVEVHESYHEWLAGWLPEWRAGRMLTIDYGAAAERLYYRRPRGSLRGYLLHQRLEGAECYANPGRIDLTADVNFTDLTAWALPWAATRGLMTQAEFLRPHAAGGDAADQAMLDPEGAGGAFLVLEQEPRGGGPGLGK